MVCSQIEITVCSKYTIFYKASQDKKTNNKVSMNRIYAW